MKSQVINASKPTRYSRFSDEKSCIEIYVSINSMRNQLHKLNELKSINTLEALVYSKVLDKKWKNYKNMVQIYTGTSSKKFLKIKSQ